MVARPTSFECRCRSRVSGRETGLGLVELMLVTVVLGIVSALAIPSYKGFVEKSKITQAKQDIVGIETAIAKFQVSVNRLPDSLADIGWGGNLDP
jgi:general secretion pathway protein G